MSDKKLEFFCAKCKERLGGDNPGPQCKCGCHQFNAREAKAGDSELKADVNNDLKA